MRLPGVSDDPEIIRQQCALLYRNAGLVQPATLISSTILVLASAGTVPTPALLAWWCVVAVTAVARWRLAVSYSKRLGAEDANVRESLNRFIVFTALAGLLWSSGCVLMMWRSPEVLQLFVALIMAGMVAGGLPALSVVVLTYGLFATPILFTVAAVAFVQAQGLRGWLLGVAALILFVAVMRGAKHFHDALHQSLRLAIEQRQIVAELKIAKSAAEAANEAKTAFLANISHEIRTPMNGLIGLTESLFDSPLSPAQKETAGLIGSSAQSLLSVINDILDMSKIEAGKFTITVAPFDPVQTARDAVRLYAPLAEQKGLKLEFQSGAGLPSCVESDEVRVRQVLLNLLANAIKFTDRGTVRLTVSCPALTSSSTTFLRFAVADTGIGIPHRLQSKLFTPFTQLADKRASAGTGLGLAISRRLAELMGGTLCFESAQGTGSTFWLDIPLKIRECDASCPRLQQSFATSVARLSAEVLLAEDNAVNQRVASHFLKKLGAEVVAVADGSQAVAALSARRYDLVFMDCQMPGMDGFAATKAIREMEEGTGRRSVIIALTANARAEDREKCLAAGMDDHLAKPISAPDLAAMLTKWLDPANVVAPEAAPEQPIQHFCRIRRARAALADAAAAEATQTCEAGSHD